MASAQSITSSLDKLKLSKKKPELADSWEEDADEEGTIAPPTATTRPRPLSSSAYPPPPPPTPASPSVRPANTLDEPPHPSFLPSGGAGASDAGTTRDAHPSPARRAGGAGAGADERRPEKSTAVASRLIAAGIGQKAPRRTPEQREYDQAMRRQEQKRREEARAAVAQQQLDTERAKRAIWDD